VDKEIDQNNAAQILNIPEDNVMDGVRLLESEKLLNEADVLHFEGLGSSSLTLSEREAEDLRNDKRVMAVEEDLEVHILAEPLVDNGMVPSPAADQMRQVTDNPFQEGYQKALLEVREMITGMINSIGRDVQPDQARPVLDPRLPVRPVPPPILPPLPIIQPTPWNINLVKAPKAWPRTRGENVKVAILDTGIASHPDLIISGGASFVPGVTSYNDDHGHGTHCAGIAGARNNSIGVIGVAPRCRLYAVKVLNSAGSGQLSWILAGMAWARNNGMQVVSMSLGSESGPIAAYTTAVQQLLAAGCVVVAAAGNSFNGGFPMVNAPANSPGVIAVGAVDQNGVIASFSSRGGTGNQVTISAPGVSINSIYLSNGYRTMSGTSMACPHVAGAVAMLKFKFPTWSPTSIRNRLRSSASDLGVPGNDTAYGAGLLNCDAATL
jgi:subtilisin